MKWLTRLFRRKTDPLAELRIPPTSEMFQRERAISHAEMVADILCEGKARLGPWMNCAPGTYGAAVMDAVQKGYLRQTKPSQPDYEHGGWSSACYEVTQHGMNRLANIGR